MTFESVLGLLLLYAFGFLSAFAGYSAIDTRNGYYYGKERVYGRLGVRMWGTLVHAVFWPFAVPISLALAIGIKIGRNLSPAQPWQGE